MLTTQKVSENSVKRGLDLFLPIIEKENLFTKLNDFEIYNYCAKKTMFKPFDSQAAIGILRAIESLRFIYMDEQKLKIFQFVKGVFNG